jgi:citrate synthase
MSDSAASQKSADDSKSSVAAGLKGVVVAETATSTVYGEEGRLIFRGYDIHDLADNSTFEEVVALLWNGDLPSRADLADMVTLLAREREVPKPVLDLVRSAPSETPPMAILRTAASALGEYDPEAEDMTPEANRRKATRLTARLATLTAAIFRSRKGQEPVPPDPALNHAANFLFMCFGERASAQAVRAMDMALVIHAEQGFNASTFSSRVTSATLSDMYSAITSAIGTLKGPLHGGANQRVLEMLYEIGSPERVADYVDAKLAKKERIMGFGHRVYRVEDPRGRHLKQVAEELAAAGQGDPTLLDIQNRLIDVMMDRKGMAINVDFWSASLYTYLGFPADLFPPLFAISRVAGWTSHVMEQYSANVLIRPRAQYVGRTGRRYVPVADRG